MNKPEFGKYKIELFHNLFENIECQTIDKYYSNWTNIQNLNDQCIAYKKAITGQIIPLSAIHKDIKFNFNNRNFIKIYSNEWCTIGLRIDGSIEIFNHNDLSNVTDLYLFNYNFINASELSYIEIKKLDYFERNNYVCYKYIPFNKSDYQFKEIYITELYFIGIKNDDTFIIVCLDNRLVISIWSKLYNKYSNLSNIQIQNIQYTSNFIFILTNNNKLIYFKINFNNIYNMKKDDIQYLLDINIDNEYIYIYYHDILYLLDINNKLVKHNQINFFADIKDTQYKKIVISERVGDEGNINTLFIGLTFDGTIKFFNNNEDVKFDELNNKDFTDILLVDSFTCLFFKLDNVYILNDDDYNLVEYSKRYGHKYYMRNIYIKKENNLIISLDHKLEYLNIDNDGVINKELYLKIKDYNFLDIISIITSDGDYYFAIKK
jgi:hypothetical protein